MSAPLIRLARAGEEAAIHESHMRSIREICVKDHGPEEVRGWGNRALGNRWTAAIAAGEVWVVEAEGAVQGHAHLRIFPGKIPGKIPGQSEAFLDSLYLTPELLGLGLGKKLMELALAKAKAAGAKVFRLESTLTSHEFYLKLGFRDSGPLQRVEVNGSQVRCWPMEMRL